MATAGIYAPIGDAAAPEPAAYLPNLITRSLTIQTVGGAPVTGSGTLAAGSATISTNASDATNAQIFLTGRTATGFLRVSAQTNTGFTVTSSDGADVGTFVWWVMNPTFTA